MAPRDEIHREDHGTEQPVTGLAGIPQKVVLPLPPDLGNETAFEMEIYARFMRHLRRVPNSRMEIKILSSIQFTADMLDLSDALIAKTLVDLGLRAPRKAFPVSYLDFVDKAIRRQDWADSVAPVSTYEMRRHWDRIGERHVTQILPEHYSLYNEDNYVTV